jgi:hypothetical protein
VSGNLTLGAWSLHSIHLKSFARMARESVNGQPKPMRCSFGISQGAVAIFSVAAWMAQRVARV